MKIAYQILQNSVEDGERNAPNLINIQKALQLETISIVFNAEHTKPWEGFLKYRLGVTLRNVCPNFNTGNIVRTCQ